MIETLAIFRLYRPSPHTHTQPSTASAPGAFASKPASNWGTFPRFLQSSSNWIANNSNDAYCSPRACDPFRHHLFPTRNPPYLCIKMMLNASHYHFIQLISLHSIKFISLHSIQYWTEWSEMNWIEWREMISHTHAFWCTYWCLTHLHTGIQ